MPGSLRALPGPNRAVVRWRFCTASSVPPRAKTAGNWSNTPEKHAPMGCNGCSPALSGIPIVCATICALTPFSISATSPPLWSSTKRVFPNRGRSRQASGCSIAEPLDRSRIVRWASFSRMSQPEGIRSLTANSTCPWTGQRTVSAVKLPVSQSRCASRRNRNWRDACWCVFGMHRYRLLGWWQTRSSGAQPGPTHLAGRLWISLRAGGRLQ